eukprot:2121727-Amphidinium_carterae.1
MVGLNMLLNRLKVFALDNPKKRNDKLLLWVLVRHLVVSCNGIALCSSALSLLSTSNRAGSLLTNTCSNVTSSASLAQAAGRTRP